MLKVDPLFFSLLIESCIVFLVLAIFFFRKYRGLLAAKVEHINVPEVVTQEKEKVPQPPEPVSTASLEEVEKLKAEIARQNDEIEELLGYKKRLDRLQAKFAEMNEFNAKLKNQLTLVVTKVEKNEELDKILADFEQKNRELNAFTSSLELENRQLSKQTDVFETEIGRLSTALGESVDKSEYEKLSEENQSLKQEIAELETKLKEQEKAHENLVKKYDSLENEYTILYEKHQD